MIKKILVSIESKKKISKGNSKDISKNSSRNSAKDSAKTQNYWVDNVAECKLSNARASTLSNNKKLANKTSGNKKLANKPPLQSDINIELFPTVEYQTLVGFGGSFTESAGYNLSLLNARTQKTVLRNYFGNKGLGYTLCRTHIQSCDFALGSYAYVIDKNDRALKTFSIARDKVYLIPFIKSALKESKEKIKILASPWSPPPFMKSNNSMTHGGILKENYAAMWAEMYAKYIQSYAQEGIDIWAVSIQNEPEAVQTWDSCLYSAKEEGDFIITHLQPTLKKHALSPHIIAWDHNRDQLYKRAKEIYKHPAARHIWGCGFHWYEEIFLGKALHKEVEKTHKAFPDKHLIMTEGCQELVGLKTKMGDWSIGERYARNIIGDLNAWCEGWIDWNMILDEKGGPNHVMNLCDAPIKVNPTTQEIIYANSYYYIGHFSKYIRPGAVRIKHKITHAKNAGTETDTDTNTNKLQISTWKDKNKIIVVLLNIGDKKLETTIALGSSQLETRMAGHSIKTIVIEI